MARPERFELPTYCLEGNCYCPTELRTQNIGARYRTRTGMLISKRRILNPLCFPIPPSALLNINGGNGEIRTHGGFTPSTVFKTATLNHSVTFPSSIENLRVGATGGIRTHNGLSSRVYETRASNRRASVALIFSSLFYHFQHSRSKTIKVLS